MIAVNDKALSSRDVQQNNTLHEINAYLISEYKECLSTSTHASLSIPKNRSLSDVAAVAEALSYRPYQHIPLGHARRGL